MISSNAQLGMFGKMLRSIFIAICVVAIVFAYVPLSKTVYGASAGSSFSTAVQLSSGTVKTGTLSGGAYYYKFTKNSGSCKVILSAVSGSKTATLYDSNYSAIASCSSSAGASSAGTTDTYYLLGGTYYIKVSGANGDYNVAYYWSNTNETIAETQTSRHDSFSDAASINVNKLSVGQLGYRDSADAFIFDIPHDGTITISKFFVSGDNSVIKGQLYNMNGVPEGSSFSTANGPDNVYTSDITKGTHYVIFSGGQGKYYYNLSYSEVHSYGQWTIVKPATCSQTGEKQRKCSKCEQTETDSIPIDPSAHSFGQWGITEPATCSHAGEKQRECSLCHTTENQAIPAGHKWKKEYTVDKKATYAVTGSKSIHCSVCNAKKPGSTVSIPKLKVSAPTISKPKAIKKGFTVKWKKVSVANGYQIQYALNSKFTKSKKTVKITKASTVSKKITKLKAKKKYYVKVRAYKVVSGKTYYSAWSKVKTVTTKK